MYLDICGSGYHVPNWVIGTAVCSYAVYKYTTWNYGLLEKRGIRGPKPSFPFGNFGSYMKHGLWESDLKWEKEFGPVYGLYIFRRHMINVSDPDMLKEIFVKEFANFPNRLKATVGDPALDCGLNNLQGEQWKNVRGILSPTFSSGKLKLMVPHINATADIWLTNLEAFEKEGKAFEAYEQACAFTIDIIGRVGYGLQVNSQVEKDNTFVRMANTAFSFNLRSPKLILAIMFPPIMRLLNTLRMPLFPKDVRNFFVSVMEEAMKRRSADDTDNVDLLQLMMHAHSADIPYGEWRRGKLSHDEVIANALILFIAGFETTAISISFALHTLATNMDIQQRVQDEIDSVLGDEEDLNYEMLQRMPYIEMVLEECLRLYPVAPRLRRTTENYCCIKGIEFKKGEMVTIPVYAIHMDENVYPDPHKFDPERFTKEAKEKRSPLSWLPFGYGPRHCIGMRLAIMEIKIALIHILRKYTVVTCKRTPIPIKLNKLRLKAEEGIYLKLQKRNT